MEVRKKDTASGSLTVPEHTQIGNIRSSRIGLGTWAMGGFQWGGADDDESVRTIHAALDLGITLIDTAPAYGFGHSESVIGRAIAERGRRDEVVLATVRNRKNFRRPRRRRESIRRREQDLGWMNKSAPMRPCCC